MKKPLYLLFVCLLALGAFAQNGKVSPVMDNPSIRKSEKEQSKQTNEFRNHKRYSNLVNSTQAKAQRKQQARTGGKGKGCKFLLKFIL